MLGSKGESEGRSIRGFNSGAGFGDVGVVVVGQGNGGPCLGNVPPDGDFLMEGSLFGAISIPMLPSFQSRSDDWHLSPSRKIRKEMRKDGKREILAGRRKNQEYV